MSTDVISVRVKREIKEEASRLGIDLRDVVEDALERAIHVQNEKRTKKAIEGIKQEMKGVSEEQWVQAVKQSRKKRGLVGKTT
jgi:antitoxin component of RelBE/YafQ-DinJ toxin-antitoxin module